LRRCEASTELSGLFDVSRDLLDQLLDVLEALLAA
jgi:hypothetical protein